jgi:hypothetical protein
MYQTNLKWDTDDGIYLQMLNDVSRNAYYDRILSQSVKGKRCCEVGFGTGLLSLLAIRHGAEHIIAYEKNWNRFLLGQEVIKKLDLSSKIELRNIDATIDDFYSDSFDIVFHEIVNQVLWGEGVWKIRPRRPDKTYVPGQLFFELHAQEISDSTLFALTSGGDVNYFNPGVEVDIRYIDFVNQCILGNDSKNVSIKDCSDDLFRLQWDKIHQFWTWNPVIVFQQNIKKVIAGYQVDFSRLETLAWDSAGMRHCDFDLPSCELKIDLTEWRNKHVMLQPRFGLKHHNDILYLDSCRNWGVEAPWIFSHPTSQLMFKQNFQTTGFEFKKI